MRDENHANYEHGENIFHYIPDDLRNWLLYEARQAATL